MTRGFLAKVQAECPHLPMLLLSDFDPDGLNILSCYRYGTTNFSHESSNVRVNFGWLGIQSGHLGSLYKTKNPMRLGTRSQTRVFSNKWLVNLTNRDRQCAIRMLGRHFRAEDADFEKMLIRHELQLMLMIGIKAEIEHLDDGGDITPWLDSALQKVFDVEG
ncbi:meiotic recombination protein spo11 [Cordyceps javanica]|nr:meiotic recombination protein spo11 [Cordyceps javanica]